MKKLSFILILGICSVVNAAPRYAFNNGNQQTEIKNSIVTDLMALTTNTDCRPIFFPEEDSSILFTLKRNVDGRLNIKKKNKIIYSEWIDVTYDNYNVFYLNIYNFIQYNCSKGE